LKLADVFLDTYPYNCGSTSNDVINAGIELVTMSGRTMVSRMGLSLLKSHNKTISVSKSIRSYESKVVKVFDRDDVVAEEINNKHTKLKIVRKSFMIDI
jgi:predicted O-linked N-acetylglucosamine transferase (SPINDLY family)